VVPISRISKVLSMGEYLVYVDRYILASKEKIFLFDVGWVWKDSVECGELGLMK
jgi:hypothetical protein